MAESIIIILPPKGMARAILMLIIDKHSPHTGLCAEKP